MRGETDETSMADIKEEGRVQVVSSDHDGHCAISRGGAIWFRRDGRIGRCRGRQQGEQVRAVSRN